MEITEKSLWILSCETENNGYGVHGYFKDESTGLAAALDECWEFSNGDWDQYDPELLKIFCSCLEVKTYHEAINAWNQMLNSETFEVEVRLDFVETFPMVQPEVVAKHLLASIRSY